MNIEAIMITLCIVSKKQPYSAHIIQKYNYLPETPQSLIIFGFYPHGSSSPEARANILQMA